MKEPFELTWRHKLEIYCDGFMSDNLFATRAEIREVREPENPRD